MSNRKIAKHQALAFSHYLRMEKCGWSDKLINISIRYQKSINKMTMKEWDVFLVKVNKHIYE